jgi:hypothetical protein
MESSTFLPPTMLLRLGRTLFGDYAARLWQTQGPGAAPFLLLRAFELP